MDMATDNIILGPFAYPVPWHVIESTTGGTVVYCVDAKTFWEARAAARALNPQLNTEKATYYANVTTKQRKR